MKVSLQWLREWVDVGHDAAALSHSLTMAGLEIESVQPAASPIPGVVVAEIVAVERHPDAEKLNVCRVSTGRETLQIVCGAPNVRVGMKAPLAVIGATLPGGVAIKQAKLRGVDSFGMLCSARELELSEDASGLLDLPQDLPTGKALQEVLGLDDTVLEVNLTPNRGDCMSIAGIAREAAAIYGKSLHAPRIEAVPSKIADVFPVRIDAPAACPVFASRVIRGIRGNQPSPLWMRERLRRAGLRPINLFVDITNYIVLELGQPMHAYDLGKLQGGLVARWAHDGEPLALLDGRTVELSKDVLVIADASAAVGMAGVMGGAGSAISAATTDLLLESAHFVPDAVAGRGRRYGLITDASQRFERGVDPKLPAQAIERATRLILEYAGGEAGPTTVMGAPPPAPMPIELRYARIGKVLGAEIPPSEVDRYLVRLGMEVETAGQSARVRAPSSRFDIRIEEDLIEEVARLYGYNRIEPVDAVISQLLGTADEGRIPKERAADLLVDRGYHEAITYSFVDPQWQALMIPGEARALLNPISAELGVMRRSLWPGLIQAALENLRRQQSRVRLFEVGRQFADDGEYEMIAGVVLGSAMPEQWDAVERKVDFFDVKADVEAILALTGNAHEFAFEKDLHPALHPGQTARVLRAGHPVGWLGAVHPEVAKKMDLTYGTYVFELAVEKVLKSAIPELSEISRFPGIRRDLAVIVDEAVEFDVLRRTVQSSAGALLKSLSVLSVYRGEQIDKGKKSIALGLNLQDTSRTLTDQDADGVVVRVVEDLRGRFNAGIRDK